MEKQSGRSTFRRIGHRVCTGFATSAVSGGVAHPKYPAGALFFIGAAFYWELVWVLLFLERLPRLFRRRHFLLLLLLLLLLRCDVSPHNNVATPRNVNNKQKPAPLPPLTGALFSLARFRFDCYFFTDLFDSTGFYWVSLEFDNVPQGLTALFEET